MIEALMILMIALFLFSLKKPLVSFIVLIFLFFNFNSWYGIKINQTLISFTDFYYIVFLLAFLLIILNKKLKINIRPLIDNNFLLISLFIFSLIILPFFGVMRWEVSILNVSSGLRTFQFFLLLLIAFVFVYNFGSKVIKYFTICVLVTGFVQGIYGLLQYGSYLDILNMEFNHYSLSGERKWYLWGRATGLLVQPNSYGGFMALISIFLYGIYISRPLYVKNKYVYLISFCLSISSVFISGSRTGLIMLVVGLLSLIVVSRSHKTFFKTISFLIPIVILVLVFNESLLSNLVARFSEIMLITGGQVGEVANLIGRINAWNLAWEEYGSNILGTWISPSHYMSSIGFLNLTSPPDNYYVNLLLQGGFFLVIVFCISFCFILNFTYKNYVANHAKQINFFSFAIIIALMIGSLTFTPLLQAHIATYIWVVLGLSLGEKVTI